LKWASEKEVKKRAKDDRHDSDVVVVIFFSNLCSVAAVSAE
jgi:hypothetical protein